MANNKVQKRKYVIGLLVLLAMATVSTYAWTVDTTTVDDEPVKVYVTSSGTATATISDFVSKPLGKNKIQIKFTYAGTATNCTFQFIDSDGEIIVVDDGANTVNWGGVEMTAFEDGYSHVVADGNTYTITVEGTGVISDLDGSGADYQGLLLYFSE